MELGPTVRGPHESEEYIQILHLYFSERESQGFVGTSGIVLLEKDMRGASDQGFFRGTIGDWERGQRVIES